MSSMLLNTIFSAHSNGNMQPINERLSELEYEYYKGKIKVPYIEEWEHWEIKSSAISYKEGRYIQFEATHQDTGKKSSSYVHEKP